MRILLSVALLLAAASCTGYGLWSPPPGQLTLSNYRFDHARIEAAMAAGPDCAVAAPGAAPPTDFILPYKGTRVLVAAPNADICWRRQLAGGQWTPWNRAFTGSGRFIDAPL